MKKRIIAIIMTFCLLLSNMSIIYASIENDKKNNISSLDSKTENFGSNKKNANETEPSDETGDNENPPVPEQPFTGEKDGHYYKDDVLQTGFIKVEGKMYYFDPNLKDENDIEGLKFIPSKNGIYLKGGKYYYFFNNGIVKEVSKSGIYKVDNKYYYIYSNNSVYKSSTSGKKKIGS